MNIGVHAIGEHSGRYMIVVNHFAEYKSQRYFKNNCYSREDTVYLKMWKDG